MRACVWSSPRLNNATTPLSSHPWLQCLFSDSTVGTHSLIARGLFHYADRCGRMLCQNAPGHDLVSRQNFREVSGSLRVQSALWLVCPRSGGRVWGVGGVRGVKWVMNLGPVPQTSLCFPPPLSDWPFDAGHRLAGLLSPGVTARHLWRCARQIFLADLYIYFFFFFFCGVLSSFFYYNFRRGVGWGVEGKQVGSVNEEPQVRGCYNFYLYTNQPGNSVGSPLR